MARVLDFLKRGAAAFLPVALTLALAQTDEGGTGFNPAEIASTVIQYVGAIAAAGVGVLALTIGLTAAWRYAKRFLKG